MPGFRDLVVVVTEEPFHEEHGQEADQRPAEDGVHGIGSLEQGVRQHVQQTHAQHDARHQAGGELYPPVCQPENQRDPAANQRSQKNQKAIDDQQ